MDTMGISTPPTFCGRIVTIYDRVSSNNAARIKLWLLLRRRVHDVVLAPTTHATQKEEHFKRINPLGKVPAAAVERPGVGGTSPLLLAEAAVIVAFLEDCHQDELSMRRGGGWACLSGRPSCASAGSASVTSSASWSARASAARCGRGAAGGCGRNMYLYTPTCPRFRYALSLFYTR